MHGIKSVLMGWSMPKSKDLVIKKTLAFHYMQDVPHIIGLAFHGS